MITEAGVKTATRDGVKLAYLDAGSGEPALMFVHGWCSDHTFWRDQIPEFAQRHRVVAVDLRGLGESDKPDQDYDIDGYVEDVAWLSREVGLDRPVLVGHSMGGVIALNVIRKWPDLARAAVFVDAPMVRPPEEFQAFLSTLIAGLQSPGYKEVITNTVQDVLFRPESPAEVRNDVAERMAAAPQRLTHTAIASAFSEKNRPGGSIPVPSLFVGAATQPATQDELRERYPGMEVTTVDSSHMIQLEKPQEFNAILSRFLEKLA
jgi:pimeloyl-ACP methyl ester carboxylesterase